MKLIYLTLIISTFASISCTKDAKIWERTPVSEAKMLSFGFYKADNPDLLLKDYIIDKITSNNLVILLPETIDRSSLVARFTLGGDVNVSVGGTTQRSGETSNNFSIPIDYIISASDYNAKYTVTVAKGSDYIWKPIPFTIVDSATTLLLKVNPVDDAPYIMYNQSRSALADSKVAMATFDNNVWVDMGAISDGRAGSYAFTFNSTGVPFASYADYTTPVAQFNTVKKRDGSSWSLVGDKGFTPVRVSFTAVTFDYEAKLKVFNVLDAAGGGFARREPGVSTFENNSWTIAKISDRPSAVSTYLPVAVLKNDAIYLALYNAVTPNSFSLYKFSNGIWTTLLDAWRDPNATTGNIYDFDIDVDIEGNVYIATSDNSDGGAAKLRVLKFNETTKTVTSVGQYIAGITGGSANFDLALSPLGTPALMYKNSSNYPAIITFDDETQDWSIPFIFESEAADQMALDFAANGEAYAAYIKNRKMFVYKYTLP